MNGTVREVDILGESFWQQVCHLSCSIMSYPMIYYYNSIAMTIAILIIITYSIKRSIMNET